MILAKSTKAASRSVKHELQIAVGHLPTRPRLQLRLAVCRGGYGKRLRDGHLLLLRARLLVALGHEHRLRGRQAVWEIHGAAAAPWHLSSSVPCPSRHGLHPGAHMHRALQLVLVLRVGAAGQLACAALQVLLLEAAVWRGSTHQAGAGGHPQGAWLAGGQVGWVGQAPPERCCWGRWRGRRLLLVLGAHLVRQHLAELLGSGAALRARACTATGDLSLRSLPLAQWHTHPDVTSCIGQ